MKVLSGNGFVYIVVEYMKDNFEYVCIVDVFEDRNDAEKCINCLESYSRYSTYIIVEKPIKDKGEVQ